jgi:RNA-directed DNA polymerase
MNEIFNLEKLYSAYLDCRKRKRKTINALKFEWDLERNLFLLLNELKLKKYKPGRSICFVVEKPTPREIFASNFKDRVVHHLLVREIEEIGEKTFIFNAFSCRKGKGTHKAIKKLREGIRKASKNYTREIYYMQIDIAGFFMSIDHNILCSILEKLIRKEKKSFQWKSDILWLAKTIIFHKPIDNYVIKGIPSLFSLIPPRKSLFRSGKFKGLPIGNYSSQFFANLYLNELDQFVKRNLKCKYYFRYVDDVVLLENNKENLKHYRDRIDIFSQKELDLRLNKKKTKIQLVRKGIDFLGYIVRLDYVLVRKRVVGNLIVKLKRATKNPFIICEDFLLEFLAMVNSYFGHFRHANSFNLRKNIYKNRFGKLKEKFLPETDYNYLRLRK